MGSCLEGIHDLGRPAIGGDTASKLDIVSDPSLARREAHQAVHRAGPGRLGRLAVRTLPKSGVGEKDAGGCPLEGGLDGAEDEQGGENHHGDRPLGRGVASRMQTRSQGQREFGETDARGEGHRVGEAIRTHVGHRDQIRRRQHECEGAEDTGREEPRTPLTPRHGDRQHQEAGEGERREEGGGAAPVRAEVGVFGRQADGEKDLAQVGQLDLQGRSPHEATAHSFGP